MSIPAISWWSIAYLVVIGSVLSFIAYIYMLQNLPAEINSIYAYINPIVAVLLGALILRSTYNGDRNWRWNNYFWFVYGESFD
jgi:drug/metabolite transporter (DMT)-like permease